MTAKSTSTAAKRKYNDKVYAKVQAELPKEIVTAFREKCKKENISQASVLLSAMQAYLDDAAQQ